MPATCSPASSRTATWLDFAEELPAKLRSDFAGTMKILRDADFQKLLRRLPARRAHTSSSRRA